MALTRAATDSTYYRDDLTPEQVQRNREIVAMSGPVAVAAAADPQRYIAGAFVEGRLAGFVLSTRHAPGDHELDWLMVHPDFHGAAVSRALMLDGMSWLGLDRPMWLTVLQFNGRAIAFYRRFGFEIDPSTPVRSVHANWIMRRPAGPLQQDLSRSS
ncbi:MAG: GNAT family N-acetyltransferase [Caulobacteraceae bacterium]|nr:GNAT family N-acetyltransferase [Caulobacteraceae bacterium]